MTNQYIPYISLQDAKQRKQAFDKSIDNQGYDVLLTLTFSNGASIGVELADFLIDIYLGKLDRLYFGKVNGKQLSKIERDVFREQTDEFGNRWIHYHILLRSIGNRELFRENAKALWSNNVLKAQTADVRFYSEAGYYMTKKDWRHGDIGKDVWLELKGHTDKGTKAYSQALKQGESKQALRRIQALHFGRKTAAQTKALLRQQEWR